MRCVVMVASLLMMANSARAELPALDVDSALLRGVIESVIDNDQSSMASAGTIPLLLPMAAQNNNVSRATPPPQLSGIGLGLQVGAPTAITIKFAGLQANGFVVGVGAGFAYGRGYAYGYNRNIASLSIHADYLWHLATLANTGDFVLTAYAGVGLWLSLFGNGYGFGLVNPYAGYNTYFGVGVRVPLGLSLALTRAPIEVYLEADPALFVFPGVDFGLGASLGFRWHF